MGCFTWNFWVKVLRSVKVFKVSKVLRPFENDGGFVCSWWILNLVFLRGVGLGVEGCVLGIFGIEVWGFLELRFEGLRVLGVDFGLGICEGRVLGYSGFWK